jgi:HD superfamily phosphodiesterase
MKCPGQDTRYWKPGDIFDTDCPHCGNKVEFFKDEATRKCRNCRKTVVNPRMDFGCAAYCKYAADCLGEMGPELLAKRNDLLKDRVAVEVKRLLGRDFQRIAHAVKVARLAEEIARVEKAEAAIVLCAAHLHLLLEGPEPGNRKVILDTLERLGASPELIRRTIEIIEQLHAGTGDSIEARVLLDAHRLANASEKGDDGADSTKGYFTAAGGQAASKMRDEGQKAAGESHWRQEEGARAATKTDLSP